MQNVSSTATEAIAITGLVSAVGALILGIIQIIFGKGTACPGLSSDCGLCSDVEIGNTRSTTTNISGNVHNLGKVSDSSSSIVSSEQ